MTKPNISTARWLALQIFLFALYFALSCLYYHFYLTNEYTPGGDGGRIYTYLKYMEKVPEIIPFWQAHKYHGYPLLADPENHMLWSLFLDTESPYFNIQLNMVFFTLTAVFAFCCRGIGRILGFSEVAAFAVGLVSISCVPMVRVFMHGSLSSLQPTVFIYVSIFMILYFVQSQNTKSVLLLLISSLLMAAALVTTGYYFPLAAFPPLVIGLSCLYLSKETRARQIAARIFVVLSIISVLTLLFSLPLVLPVIDGVVSSRIFFSDSPVINVTDAPLYNFYLGLWPFILLAVIYARGTLRRCATLFAILGSVNLILILLEIAGCALFFDVWSQIPILRNIRWQHPFTELASIGAAFCLGIYLDASRTKEAIEPPQTKFVLIGGFCLLMAVLAFGQYQNGDEYHQIVISLLFILVALVGRRFRIALSLSLAILLLMIVNFEKCPLGNQLYKATNSQKIQTYVGPYRWMGGYGYDEFTPSFAYGKYSMVFIKEYRNILSVMTGVEIMAQRPHWVGLYEEIDETKVNKRVERLMAIDNPVRKKAKRKDRKNYKIRPFRVYDRWVVLDDENALKMMTDGTFSVNGPIILAQEPPFEKDANKRKLNWDAKLTGKTADTLTLHVKTDRNSILFIPEIYHRDWTAEVDGERAPVIKAYASMRAVPIGSGEHTIVLRFVYRPFYWGLAISGFMLFFSFLLLLVFRDKVHRYLSFQPL